MNFKKFDEILEKFNEKNKIWFNDIFSKCDKYICIKNYGTNIIKGDLIFIEKTKSPHILIFYIGYNSIYSTTIQCSLINEYFKLYRKHIINKLLKNEV